jgi:hypothetical protein
MLKENEKMTVLKTYGNDWNVLYTRVVSILFALFALAFIAFAIYAFVSGKITFTNSHGLTPAAIEGIFITVLLAGHLYGLRKISKTVQKAELDNYRLKMTTIMGQIDLPIESIQSLRDGSRPKDYLLETSDGQYIFVFKPRDEVFASALKAESARRRIR